MNPDILKSALEKSVRQVLEESAWHFRPSALVGIYLWSKPAGEAGLSYLRFAFCGELEEHEPERQLDAGIVRTVWLDREEIRASSGRHRSPLVLRCVEDYLAGRRYGLELLTDYA